MVTLRHISYSLPLSTEGKAYFPLGLRPGLLLHISLRDGSSCMGEYAPIQSIHNASIDQALSLVKGVDLSLVEEFLLSKPEDAALLARGFAYPLGNILSLAYFHRHLENRIDLAAHSLQLSSLIGGASVLDAVNQAHQRIAQGYRCLKIKVGQLSILEEEEKIKRIVALKPDIRLRLDANKRLFLVDAVKLLRALPKINIEYFEEPLINEMELAALYEQSGVPIAVDESFKESMSLEEVFYTKAQYLILKASRFSNIFAVQNLCKQALKLSITPIFSTCFESDFFCSLMALAAADAGLINKTHGLWADNFFDKNIARIPLRPIRAQLPLTQPLSLLSSLMQEI